MQFLPRLVFAVAAATFAASMGVAAPPHRVADGTPLAHTLALGAYRYAFLVDPGTVDASLPPQMAALHRMLALAGIPMPEMAGMPNGGRTTDLPTFHAAGGIHPCHDLVITLALLALLPPRLPRPTRLLLARLDPFAVRPAQWWPTLPLSPPRRDTALMSAA